MLKELIVDNFAPFGKIIECPKEQRTEKYNNVFEILTSEEQNVGWRIAYLLLRDKRIERLEQHPDTYEAFVPVSGKTFIFVAREKNAATITCFQLTRPVILNKGIWHGLVTDTKESEISITENADVQCHFWDPGFALSAVSGHPLPISK